MIIYRKAESEDSVVFVSNAMESAGATVFSITRRENRPSPSSSHAVYNIWAKVTDDAHAVAVDEAIKAAMDLAWHRTHDRSTPRPPKAH